MMNIKFESFWNQLKEILVKYPSSVTVFNQYRDKNERVDVLGAANIRLENLHNYLKGVVTNTSILIVGEAAGPWGCRFSGIPFTGEKQILENSFPISGLQSSKMVPEISTRIKPPYVSASALMFWKVMWPYHQHFLLWDAFPLHPHKQGDILTVRNPTKGEVKQFGNALNLIKAYLSPRQIVAIGRKAFEELEILGYKSVYVRHPSRGGFPEFSSGIRQIFNELR